MVLKYTYESVSEIRHFDFMSLLTLIQSSRASLSVPVLILLFMAGVHNLFKQRYDFYKIRLPP